MKLNPHRADSWAVVGLPSQAIALTASGALIMRLSREAAQKIADDLNRAESETPPGGAQFEARIG